MPRSNNKEDKIIDEISRIASRLNDRQMERLMNMINNLQVDEETEGETEEETIDEIAEFEVEKIVGHRIVNGKFQFLVKFKYYDEPEYIDDSDTNCEKLINSYLPENILTIYIICRVSTKNQSDENTVSLAQQEDLITSTMQNMYPTPNKRIKIIHHVGSAFNKLPLYFPSLVNNARKNDVIAVYRIDRLSRNITTSLNYLNDLDSKGVHIYSCHEKIYYHDNKAQFLTFLLNGQRDAEDMSSRQKRILEFRKKRGDEGFGVPKYGKKHIREEETRRVKVVDNEIEKEIIKYIIDNPDRLSTIRMMNKLNGENKLKRGKKWNRNMILRIRKENATI